MSRVARRDWTGTRFCTGRINRCSSTWSRNSSRFHEAYRVYGSSRVSCCFCILNSASDLGAAARCEANHEVYRALVRLETASTFSFQPKRWLGDVAPHLLDAAGRLDFGLAKERARRRGAAEKDIPEHLLFTDGWPRCVPTRAEALLLCDVRQRVASAVGIAVDYTDPEQLVQRYEDLLAASLKCQHRQRSRHRVDLIATARHESSRDRSACPTPLAPHHNRAPTEENYA